jgi:hypothetical protein
MFKFTSICHFDREGEVLIKIPHPLLSGFGMTFLVDADLFKSICILHISGGCSMKFCCFLSAGFSLDINLNSLLAFASVVVKKIIGWYLYPNK